jgi:hypothetical protein
MISLTVDTIFVLDLKDDFLMNRSKKLLDFIGDDIQKAYYLGLYMKKWFDLLERDSQYLHSKTLRHTGEEVEEYIPQLEYWISKYPKDEDKIDPTEMAEYILNNIILFNKSDIIKLALFLGLKTSTIEGTISNEELKDIFSIH